MTSLRLDQQVPIIQSEVSRSKVPVNTNVPS